MLAATTTRSPSSDLKITALGTVKHSDLKDLEQLLEGLSNKSGEELWLHEFILKIKSQPDVILLLHNLSQSDPERWEAMTVSRVVRAGIKDLPFGVRALKCVPCTGTNVPQFWRSLGLEQQAESLRRGKRYALEISGQSLQIDVVSLSKVTKAGDVSSAEPIGNDLLLVEVKCLTGFGDLSSLVTVFGTLETILQPLVHLQKA